MARKPPTNSLGLDFDSPEVSQTAEYSSPTPADPAEPPPTSPSSTAKLETPQREKKKPYVNPDRVRTGGPQREKLTDEELKERMVRMKEQNEKIKQRRLDVAADEAAFKQTQEVERQKMERTKKIQDGIDKAREQNIKRKMDKVQHREWDSGKPTAADWKNQPKRTLAAQDTTPSLNSSQVDAQVSTTTPSDQPGSENRVKGGRSFQRGDGRGRGRGRGRIVPGERLESSVDTSAGNAQEEQPQEDGKTTEAANAA